MSTELTKHEGISTELQEKVLLGGDLSKLSSMERLNYYSAVCDSLGLNPLTRPFEYLTLNNKLQLYARKDCTDQLREARRVSILSIETHLVDAIYIVTAQAQDRDGRTDVATGAVNIANLQGEMKANAMMKAETKAKRRVTLSICGLGMLDESEIESIPAAKMTVMDGKRIAQAKIHELRTETPREPDGLDAPPTPETASQPSQDEALVNDPAEPYRAKLRTCEQSVNGINAAYHAIPETIRQDCHGQYTEQLKKLGKKK